MVFKVAHQKICAFLVITFFSLAFHQQVACMEEEQKEEMYHTVASGTLEEVKQLDRDQLKSQKFFTNNINALQLAVISNEHPEVIEWLINTAGFNKNVTDIQGYNLLQLAVMIQPKIKTIELLINTFKFDTNITVQSNGNTLLDLLIIHDGNLEVARHLVNKHGLKKKHDKKFLADLAKHLGLNKRIDGVYQIFQFLMSED